MFYIFENDITILPLIENEIYFGFELYSSSKNKKVDNLTGIVGGVGLSMIHENKRSDSEPRNSILLRCSESNLSNCLNKCYIHVYVCQAMIVNPQSITNGL